METREAMRIFATLILFALLAQAQNPVVGRWRSVETSQGGIGAIYEFRADGTATFSPGAIVPMDYRVEGNQLVLPPATKNGPEMKAGFAFVGTGRMQLTNAGATEEYSRQGATPDPRNPLLGEWLTYREMEGHRVPARMFFYHGGKALLLIAFSTQTGRFTAKDGRLEVTIAGRTGIAGAYSVKDGVLSVVRGPNRTLRLARY
jgi:hypothetical protein